MQPFKNLALWSAVGFTLSSTCTAVAQTDEPTVDRQPPPPIMVQRIPRPPVIQINDVDIYGVSELDFEPDQQAFASLGELSFRSEQDVDLYVDQTGKPVRCRYMSQSLSQSDLETICNALMSSAKVRTYDWYRLEGQQGRVGIYFSSSPAPTHEVALRDGGASPDTPVRVAFYGLDKATDEVTRCSISVPDDAIVFSSSDREGICDRFTEDAEWRASQCREEPVVTEGNSRTPLFCDVPVRKIANPLSRVYRASLRSDAQNRMPSYIGRQPSEYPDIPRAMATVRESTGRRIQYPSRALRQELEGEVRMIIGISPQGRVASCRPYQTSGHLILDNAACSQLVRYGRFDFADGADDYEGERFQDISINWLIPD